MGLDGVEIVLALEERFGIALPDADVQQARTVSDAADIVWARVPREQAGCASSRAFYGLRRLFSKKGGVPRAEVRPNAALEDLFPARRRHRWRAMRKVEPRLPPLALPPVVSRAGAVAAPLLGLAFVCLLILTCVLWGMAGVLLAIPGLVIALLVVCLLDYLFRTRLPIGVSTVRDVVQCVVAIERPHDAAQHIAARQHVMFEVRRVVADCLALPIDEVQPHSRFAEDLRVD